jgi:hypothetical protein
MLLQSLPLPLPLALLLPAQRAKHCAAAAVGGVVWDGVGWGWVGWSGVGALGDMG